jgi:sec-independent protein translocase protein TatC
MREDEKLPFTAHLTELRDRLIKAFIAVGIGFTAAYGFKERLFDLLARPLLAVMKPDDKLIFTGLTEAFFTYLKIALIAGVMLAAPVLFYQFWMFVAPGLYRQERRLLLPVIALTTLCFLCGGIFGYYVVFPYGFRFFLGFATDIIRPLPSMEEYLSFSVKMLLAFGLIFEMPLVITLMARLGLVSTPYLRRNRKYAILLFFVVAAVLTPPDVVSQFMMAVPLMGLYEISILGAHIFGRKGEPESGGSGHASGRPEEESQQAGIDSDTRG